VVFFAHSCHDAFAKFNDLTFSLPYRKLNRLIFHLILKLVRVIAMTTLEKLEDLIYRGFKETDERLAQHRRELDEQLEKHRRESDKRIERIHQQIGKELGGVTESLSRFSEQEVLAAVKRLFNKRGIPLDHFFRNLVGPLDGETMETDVIAVGPEHAVLIEVKLRLRQADVKEFLEKKLPRFFEFFPNLQRPVLYGGVAGMSIDEDADRYAYKQGLFVIGQSGDSLRIINDKKFKPHSFAQSTNHNAKRKKSR
jgi:hypothetical protein